MIVRTASLFLEGVVVSHWHRLRCFNMLWLTFRLELQHDAGLDYYGRRLATCSSDKTIKIFEIEGDSHRLVETLKG